VDGACLLGSGDSSTLKDLTTFYSFNFVYSTNVWKHVQSFQKGNLYLFGLFLSIHWYFSIAGSMYIVEVFSFLYTILRHYPWLQFDVRSCSLLFSLGAGW